jgi:hypothetical protein
LSFAAGLAVPVDLAAKIFELKQGVQNLVGGRADECSLQQRLYFQIDPPPPLPLNH